MTYFENFSPVSHHISVRSPTTRSILPTLSKSLSHTLAKLQIDRLARTLQSSVHSPDGLSNSKPTHVAIDRSAAQHERQYNHNRFSIYMNTTWDTNDELVFAATKEPSWTTTAEVRKQYQAFNDKVKSNLTWSNSHVDHVLQLVLGTEYNKLVTPETPRYKDRLWREYTELNSERDRARQSLAERQEQWFDDENTTRMPQGYDVFDRQTGANQQSLHEPVVVPDLTNKDQIEVIPRHVLTPMPDFTQCQSKESKRLAQPALADPWKSLSDRFHVNLAEFLARSRAHQMSRTTSSIYSDCPDLAPDDNDTMSARSITPDLHDSTSLSSCSRDQAQSNAGRYPSGAKFVVNSHQSTFVTGHDHCFPHILTHSGPVMSFHNIYDPSRHHNVNEVFPSEPIPDPPQHESQELLPRKATLADFLKF